MGRRSRSGGFLEGKKMIKALFIDVDDTILDFGAYVRETMRSGFRKFGLPEYEPRMYDVFRRENDELWRSLERGEIVFEDIKRDRWNIIFRELGFEADGPAFESYFRACLHDSGILIPGAKETLEELAEIYPMFVASNGPEDQQRNRLKVAGVLDLFRDVFTSGGVGASKPTKEFFDACMERAQAYTGKLDRDEVLMVGDSLTSDIGGAVEYGLRSCLFDPRGLSSGKLEGVDYEIGSWKELTDLLEKDRNKD